MTALFPLSFASDDLRLLTAVAIGGAFGFALERGGFGSARKLAAQFYLSDMTVLKVMFTAIVVAMTGVYTLAGLGLVDLSQVWINPTFVWGQLVGGFLLGLGFIMSGLCPGTSLVSAASGRIDALVAVAGIFAGTWLFGALVDWFPGLSALYTAGSLGVSTLPDLLHLPAWVVVLLVVAMAGGAFVGAEMLERVWQARRGILPLTPPPRSAVKFALTAALVMIVVVGTAARRPARAPAPIVGRPIAAMALAERIVARDPSLVILDLRRAGAENPVPGAIALEADSSGRSALAHAVPGRTTVVFYDATGERRTVPGDWPRELDYRYLAGGRAAWERDVLTPAVPAASSVADAERARRRNALASYFTGAAVAAPAAARAAPATGAGAPRKKKGGGC